MKYRPPNWSVFGRDYKGNRISTSPRLFLKKTYVPNKRKSLKLPYGYTVFQTYFCLKKCWLGFKIAKAEETMDEEKLWAQFIRKLQFHLGKQDLEDFNCLTNDDAREGMLVCIAEKYAPELMKVDISHLENLANKFERGEMYDQESDY